MDEASDSQETNDKQARTNTIRSAFIAAQAQHQQEWRRLQSNVPRRLYHYTTVQGMLGITSSHSLWASDARYLNDSSELEYAAGLIGGVVTEMFADTAIERLQSNPERWASIANGFELGDLKPFVTCFCEEADQLSQWRSYATSESGVSLGFDFSMQATTHSLPPSTFLRKVVYHEEEQRRIVKRIVQTWLNTVETLIADDSPYEAKEVFPYPATWDLQQALAEQHLCFKHPGFAEEREWRLIKLVEVSKEMRLLDNRRREEQFRELREEVKEFGVDLPLHSAPWAETRAEGVDIRFRPSPLGLVPYVDLPVRDRAGLFIKLLPLWEVVQGPTTNRDLSIESLSMYLESRGYGFHTKVTPSGIPLRP